jgi:hypothetical protein
MRLDEIMALRQRIGAGALVTLTERCPLHCAHCSTTSTLRGRLLDASGLLGFLGTFTAEDHPDVLMLTGGEPLTRPGLVADAAKAARAAGTRTAVLSGAFFARGREIPVPIRCAALAVDHLSLSIDVFHEREVPRDDVFRALRTLLRLGVATSLHIVGAGDGDPYLADVTTEVTARFGADVPMLVSEVRPIGRAANWAEPQRGPDGSAVSPCAMAAWPVIAVDGTVTACCNQDVVDGRARPAHLDLGELSTSTWREVRDRLRDNPVLRMIRTVGPLHIANRAGGCGTADYCTSCHLLPGSPALGWAESAGSGIAGQLLEAAAISRGETGGAAGLVRRHGGGRYAELVGGTP